MVNSYIGNLYKLVFPILSKGYLKLNFSDNNIDTTPNPDVTNLTTIWKHTESFALEAIITPYDVNGSAHRTTGNGILTSTKTPPYPNDSISNRATDYQSTNLLGRAEGTDYTSAPHKLTIFYNTNLKVYLENTTVGSYNQPAEYKVVAQITKGGVTKTIESETVIKSNKILFNKYDEKGYYYNGTSMEHTRLSSTATNVAPSAVVTISGSGLPVSTSASAGTATYSVNNANSSTAVSSEIKATATIDIGGSGTSDYTVPADQNVVAATGTITVKSVQAHTTSNNGTEIILYHDGTQSSDTYRFFARNVGTENAGGALEALTFGSRAFAYHRVNGDNDLTAQNLATAIERAMPTGDIVTSYNASNDTITVTMPPSSQFNNSIALGVNLGGTDFVVSGMANGNAGTVVNSYLTITDHTNTTKNYKASDSSAQATGTTGTSNGTAVVYYRNGSSFNSTANNLKTAILHSNGHGSSKFSVSTNNPLTLTSQATGVAGNSSGTGSGTTAISDTGLDNSGDTNDDLTYTQFTGGGNQVKNNSYFIITDNTGGNANNGANNITKNYQMAIVGDANFTTGSTGTSADGTAVVYFEKGSNTNDLAGRTATASNIRTAILSSNGHNGSITVSTSGGGTRTMIQATVGVMASASKTVGIYGSGFNRTNFSGDSAGGSPDKYLEIRDAAGVIRRYHAATIEAQNSTATIGGVVYVYFTNHATPATLATNLKTAIENTNGHNGSISVSRNGAVLTLTTNVNNNQLISENFSNNLAISNAGTISSGVYPWNTSNNLVISVGSNEANMIGRGSKLYDVNLNLIGTTSVVSGTSITLSSPPATAVTSTIYVNQPKEALYIEDMFKISLSYSHINGQTTLYVNNFAVASENTTLLDFQLHASDCKIGQGANNSSEQFYGEIYEISYHRGRNVCNTINTLTPNYSDILFYYRFGDIV
tara:strand:+ start:24794 stop:27610 length:2817 start_codon:yes stop_codon:yes gene_type:complete